MSNQALLLTLMDSGQTFGLGKSESSFFSYKGVEWLWLKTKLTDGLGKL